MKEFHWIDDSIKIDFEVPSYIRDLMNKCEEFDREENYEYFNWIETLDCDLKEYIITGEVSRREADLISLRYRG